MLKIVKHLLLSISFVAFLFAARYVYAADNSFVTVANPVRISNYLKHPEKSLSAQYEEVKERKLPATWLLTFDVIKNKEMLKVIRSFDEKQELGVLLEVTSSFAREANVTYNASDSWHRAKSVFLSGYTQEDRRKLIDYVFNAFKNEFGYFPKSVGSWWTDSYSLDYISMKYKITSNLSISDQLSLDEYTVWGTYYSTPYYPSKINAAIPANDSSLKINVVQMRWAARDPVNGYVSPTKEKSAMYSLQDYSSIGLPETYFEKLADFYRTRQAYNKFAHLTIGLESDLAPETYGSFGRRLAIAAKGDSEFKTMSEFADWYGNEFKDVSPAHLLVSEDILVSGKIAVWYQSPNYRAGLVYDKASKKLTLADLRPYYPNFAEPFYKSPNRQDGLYILLPHETDAVIENRNQKTFECGDYIGAEEKKISFANCKLEFTDISIKNNGEDIASNLLDIYPVDPNGETVSSIGLRVPYGLLRRVPYQILDYSPFIVGAGLLLFVFVLFNYSKSNKSKVTSVLIVFVVLLFLVSFKNLHISQSEIEALKFLYKQPDGSVLVFNKDCLNCTWQTVNEPAAMSGYKKYIARAVQKKVVESLALPLAKTPDDIIDEIKRTGASYVYLAKYEDYVEQLAFPAEELGLEKLYENANVQILKVVK